MGGAHLPRHFWDFRNKYKESDGNLTFCCHISISAVLLKNKSEGHFQSGHKYVTNYIEIIEMYLLSTFNNYSRAQLA